MWPLLCPRARVPWPVPQRTDHRARRRLPTTAQPGRRAQGLRRSRRFLSPRGRPPLPRRRPARSKVSPRAEFRARRPTPAPALRLSPPPPTSALAPSVGAALRPACPPAGPGEWPPASPRRSVPAVAVATRRQTGRRASRCGRARLPSQCLPGPSRWDPISPGVRGPRFGVVPVGPVQLHLLTSPILGPDPFWRFKAN